MGMLEKAQEKNNHASIQHKQSVVRREQAKYGTCHDSWDTTGDEWLRVRVSESSRAAD